jgi:hypothetical protein
MNLERFQLSALTPLLKTLCCLVLCNAACTSILLNQVQREFHLPPGDFPNVEHFREILSGYNIDKFEKLKPKMIQTVDDMLGYDIPDLLKNFRNPYD